MRIVASACLVLAILFMVGCGTSAEDKKMIQEHATKIQTLEKKAADMEKPAMEMAKKVADIEAYLKAKDPKYGVQDTTTKTTTTTKPTTTKPTTPPPTTPPPTKGPAKTKEPGKTK